MDVHTIALCLSAGIGLLEVYIRAGAGRTVLECAVVVVAFGLMLCWRHCSRTRWMRCGKTMPTMISYLALVARYLAAIGRGALAAQWRWGRLP